MSEPGISVVENHSHPVAAEDDETAQQIAEVLLVGATLAAMIAEIVSILAPWYIGRQAVKAAVALADSAHRAYGIITKAGLPSKSLGAKISRQAGRAEVYARASYIAAASSRIQADLDAGRSLDDAIVREKPNYASHAKARRKRLDAAARVGRAANQFGPVLGWYRDPESNSESECLSADGNNFEATAGTIIGLPGQVHPNCACIAGPPHPDGVMVNDALLGVVRLEPRSVGRGRRLAASS